MGTPVTLRIDPNVLALKMGDIEGYLGNYKIKNKNIKKAYSKNTDDLKRDLGTFNSIFTKLSFDSIVFDRTSGNQVTYVERIATNEYQVYLTVESGAVSTFKFLGMDITDDLNVYIKGAFCNVLVTNMFDDLGDRFQDFNDSNAGEYSVDNFNIGQLKVLIEDLKFGNCSFISNNRYVWGSSLDAMGIDVTNTNTQAASNYHSLTMTYLKDKFVNTKSADTGTKSTRGTRDRESLRGMADQVFFQYFKNLTDTYIKLSTFLACMDKFFTWMDLSGMSSADWGTIRSNISAPITNGGVALPGADNYYMLGNFKGFCHNNDMLYANSYNMSLGAVNAIASATISYYASSTTPNGIELDSFAVDSLMLSMSDQPDNFNYFDSTPQDKVALSMLDFIKYKDPDLAIQGYDLQRDSSIVVKNLKQLLNQVFRYFIPAGADDKAVDYLLGDGTDVPVYNMSSGTDGQNVDMLAIQKSSQLVRKLCKVVLDRFK